MTGGREKARGRGAVKTLVLGVCFGVSLLLMFLFCIFCSFVYWVTWLGFF